MIAGMIFPIALAANSCTSGERSGSLGNVAVVRETRANHNEVPRTHLADLLEAAAYLEDR